MDRLYLNGLRPRLQNEGGVVAFLRQAGGAVSPSPAIFGEITTAFRERLRAWCNARNIPWIEFRKGERKDAVVQKIATDSWRHPGSCWWAWRKNERGVGRPARRSVAGECISPGAGNSCA